VQATTAAAITLAIATALKHAHNPTRWHRGRRHGPR